MKQDPKTNDTVTLKELCKQLPHYIAAIEQEKVSRLWNARNQCYESDQ